MLYMVYIFVLLLISNIIYNLNYLFCIKGGGGRGGGAGGFKGGKTVIIEPHRHEGVFIARGKEDALVTRNFVPGSEVYGEKRISVEVSCFEAIIFLYT